MPAIFRSVILSAAKDLLSSGAAYTSTVAEEKLYYVYIVASRSRTLYVGVTSQIEVRILQHRNGTFEGFTKRYRCHRLVWFERFGFIENAIAREKEIKSWKRDKKVALIQRENPTWVDLSADWDKPVAMYDWSAEAERKQILRFAQDDTSGNKDEHVNRQEPDRNIP